MAKDRSHHVCQQCGYSQVGWAGKCPECNSWGSMVETMILAKPLGSVRGSVGRAQYSGQKPIGLASVPSRKTVRKKTRISELDRVLGGGLVPGQVVLIAGEPGIGKSTILLQVSEKLGNVLYVSGEESVSQVAIRGKRLGIKSKGIKLLEETNIDNILNTIHTFEEGSLQGVIVDSIQTMNTKDLSGMAGSVGQVRECTFRLVKLAKSLNIPIFVVGHVTKGGTVAGPAVLAHLVDTVLWFEGSSDLNIRLLRAVKNRFGPTDEVGIFTMENKGLMSMSDPKKLFLSKSRKNTSGSAVSAIMEGTRPILVEVQSLVVPTKMAYPKRIAQGIDSRRLELLLAVLSKKCGLHLGDYDCFVNLVGGISAKDTAIDLAICLSLASSYLDKPIPRDMFILGEVGLLGEIREVNAMEKRVKEAKRLGYGKILSQRQVRYLNRAIRENLR